MIAGELPHSTWTAIYSAVWETGKAIVVQECFAEDFTNWKRNNEKFERAFENVVKALRSDDAAREPPPEPKL